MMKRILLVTGLLLVVLWVSGNRILSEGDDWGFFAHKRINRLAVFILPQGMMPLFKKNIDYLSEHAVDPDKRRYAFKLEAPRHYLDMDMYKDKCLPRNFTEAFSSFGRLQCINGKDTAYLFVRDSSWCRTGYIATMTDGKKEWEVNKSTIRRLWGFFILPAYYQDDFKIEVDSVRSMLGPYANGTKQVFLVDRFTEHGIVPYFIEQHYQRLVKAFQSQDVDRILKISAEIGHYVGDAHVPLHACSNYNGQFTDQHGIHGFWESRIPELFADERYDYFVGRANYIPDVQEFAWQTITASGLLADTVLSLEQELRKVYPRDQQMCFDERLGRMVWVQCRDYADAYDRVMDGMVEKRMREAILAVGSIWYSAWIDAGQPILDPTQIRSIELAQDTMLLQYEQQIQSGSKGYGRYHD